MIRKTFYFEKQSIANDIQVGDRLYTTSAEFDYCAGSGIFAKTSCKKEFFVKELVSERIVPNDPSQSTDGGDYYYYVFVVVNPEQHRECKCGAVHSLSKHDPHAHTKNGELIRCSECDTDGYGLVNRFVTPHLAARFDRMFANVSIKCDQQGDFYIHRNNTPIARILGGYYHAR